MRPGRKRKDEVYLIGSAIFRGYKVGRNEISIKLPGPVRIAVVQQTKDRYIAMFEPLKPATSGATMTSIEGHTIAGPVDQVIDLVRERFETMEQDFVWRHLDGSAALSPSTRLL
jgi:hypothetical protein